MAYEKQTWATGDIISAEKLNYIEDGLESVSSGSEGGITKITLVENAQTGGSSNHTIGGTSNYAVVCGQVTAVLPDSKGLYDMVNGKKILKIMVEAVIADQNGNKILRQAICSRAYITVDSTDESPIHDVDVVANQEDELIKNASRISVDFIFNAYGRFSEYGFNIYAICI